MIASLVLSRDKTTYICGNCRMKQQDINSSCWFCNAAFSNYETIIFSLKEEELWNQLKLK